VSRARWRAPPERFIQIVEEREPAAEPVEVLGMGERDAGHQLLDARRIGAAELAVLQIDLMHDLGDLAEGRIASRRARP
jgi:hypothetical protein